MRFKPGNDTRNLFTEGSLSLQDQGTEPEAPRPDTAELFVKDSKLSLKLPSGITHLVQCFTTGTKTAISIGTAGQYSTDASYLYICTSKDTWKRIAWTAW